MTATKTRETHPSQQASGAAGGDRRRVGRAFVPAAVLATLAAAGLLGYAYLTVGRWFGVEPTAGERRSALLMGLLAAAVLVVPWAVAWYRARTSGWAAATACVAALGVLVAVAISAS